jgi:hypothetical protein
VLTLVEDLQESESSNVSAKLLLGSPQIRQLLLLFGRTAVRAARERQHVHLVPQMQRQERAPVRPFPHQADQSLTQGFYSGSETQGVELGVATDVLDAAGEREA